MIFSKHRFEIWSANQHPLKHSLADMSYSNPALPGVTNAEGALNWMFAAFYPNTQAAVANPAALPLLGNTIGDYRVVLDDGDGEAASYRWEQREGEIAPSWHKIYDMDWGQDSILAAFTDATQDLYVWINGRTQLDGGGSPVVGLYAGQRIFGGNLANQNLTLAANSGDGVGPSTGFVQVDDIFRPTADATFDLGTPTERWFNLYVANSIEIANQLYMDGTEISNSTGTITFNGTTLTQINHLFTQGNANIAGNVIVNSGSPDQLIISGDGTNPELHPLSNFIKLFGALEATLGFSSEVQADFGWLILTDWVNTGTLSIYPNEGGAGTNAVINSSIPKLTLKSINPGYILDVQGAVNATGEIYGTLVKSSGDVIASFGHATGQLTISNDGLDATIVANGGTIAFPGQYLYCDYIDGQIHVQGGFVRLYADTVESVNSGANLVLKSGGGSGIITTNASVVPDTDALFTLGNNSFKWVTLYLSGDISNGADTINISTLLAFRSSIWRDVAQTIPAQAGDALFWDAGNGVWLANHPDTEITHSELTGLAVGDAGHTQFAMLAGRAGGQTLYGGNAASEDLILGSTSHATKGNIFVQDTVLPSTNASFSGSWSGIDLGDATHYFRDLYTKGELKGARLENFTTGTLPGFSAQNIGRVMWATDINKAYVDTGLAVKVISISKFISDEAFDGVQLTKNVTVSADVTDARNCIWQLRDNLNNFEVLAVKLSTPDAATVTITTTTPLPVGSYRLIGVE